MTQRSNRLLIGGIVSAVALAGSTATVQSHGGNPNLIHSCVNAVGVVRIVGPNDTCLALVERPVDWGIVGPQGPQGLQGQRARRVLQDLRGRKE